MKNLFTVFFLCLFLSCGIVDDENINKDVNVVKEFSSNSLNQYMNLNTLMRDDALSKNWISHLNLENNFSIGYTCNAMDFPEKKVSKISVSTNYYFPKPGKAAIICNITKGGKSLYWNKEEINSSIALNQWAKKEVTFKPNETFSDDEQFSVYIWSADKDELFIEELIVKLIE